ncbi:hypothetical protein [Microlunatus ginsengisoli]|uniref:Uncharacterized protein n=1 Tax=Microlunatus ginsengisoli TaxID=363863 RepID=A0ABP7ALD3_9ACTN
MSNPSKAKGDRAEREAVAYLVAAVPQLVSVSRPQRKLGAGRAEDTGDLWVFDDCAVQVRSWAVAQIGTAIRSAAIDAAAQARNGDLAHGLGMVPVPRAPRGSVRWLACCLDWPAVLPREPVHFELVGRMLAWLRADVGPYGFDARPRTTRIATLPRSGGGLVLVAPMEAWLTGYSTLRDRTVDGPTPAPSGAVPAA